MRQFWTGARRRIVALTIAAVAAGGLSAALPAIAADGLKPSEYGDNVPDGKSCGLNGERWVKFTTGGGAGTGLTAKSGQPAYKATYNDTVGSFQVTSLVDEFGNVVYFSSVYGGVANENPIWTFPTAAQSPVLSVVDATGAVINDNFSQFAVCALPNPYVKASVTKQVDGTGFDSATTFTVAIDCRTVLASGVLGPDNLADPKSVTLAAGQTLQYLAPGGSQCTFGEPTVPDGFELVSIAPNPLTMPIPTLKDPHPTASATVLNKYNPNKTLTLTKSAVNAGGTFTFDVTCTAPDGSDIPVDNVTINVAAGASASTTISVPKSATCSATEINIPSGFAVDTATKPFGADGTVAFTNTATGSLKMTKVQNGGITGAVFDIAYSCTDGKAGTASLKGGDSKTIDDVASASLARETNSALSHLTGHEMNT